MPEAAAGFMGRTAWWQNTTGNKDVFSQLAILNYQFVVCQSRGLCDFAVRAGIHLCLAAVCLQNLWPSRAHAVWLQHPQFKSGFVANPKCCHFPLSLHTSCWSHTLHNQIKQKCPLYHAVFSTWCKNIVFLRAAIKDRKLVCDRFDNQFIVKAKKPNSWWLQVLSYVRICCLSWPYIL